MKIGKSGQTQVAGLRYFAECISSSEYCLIRGSPKCNCDIFMYVRSTPLSFHSEAPASVPLGTPCQVNVFLTLMETTGDVSNWTTSNISLSVISIVQVGHGKSTGCRSLYFPRSFLTYQAACICQENTVGTRDVILSCPQDSCL
jgi:hypothetical protein